MTLADSIDDQLRSFLTASRFAHEGAFITDLDGTAVHEVEGRVAIPHTVSHGLKHLNDLGRPVILNTLRFPLNVIRTFGREWHAITHAPLPLVSLNGAIIGHLTSTDYGVTFEEVATFPLARSDIEELLAGVQGLVDGGVHDLVLFYYPRNWMIGELIWTPAPERVEELRAKYLSATEITSGALDHLRQSLLSQDICMIFLLIEAEEDRLMAYQHTKRSNFVTRAGVDKLFGAQEATTRLGLNLAQCVGAGDTPMDTFLKGVGLAVQVGPLDLAFHGLQQTVKLANSLEFGALLFRLADLQRGIQA